MSVLVCDWLGVDVTLAVCVGVASWLDDRVEVSVWDDDIDCVLLWVWLDVRT